jgi:hypothetical protein
VEFVENTGDKVLNWRAKDRIGIIFWESGAKMKNLLKLGITGWFLEQGGV